MSIASDVKPLGVAATKETRVGGDDEDVVAVGDVLTVEDGFEIGEVVEVEDFGGCDPLADAVQAERVRTVRVIPILATKEARPV